MQQNCIAKTKSVEFFSNHRIPSVNAIQTYKNPSLNITKFTQQLFTNISQTEIYDIIQNNSRTNAKMFLSPKIEMELNDIIEKAKILSKFKKIQIPAHNFSINDFLPDFGLRNIFPNFSPIIILLFIAIIVALRLGCK